MLAFLVVCGAGLCRGSSSEASDSGSHAGQEAETPVRRYFGQDVSCTADASFNCGWLYIPADMEAKQLFSPGIYELSSFPGSGICTDVCLEVINSAKCKEQRDLLAEACDALQCSKNVRLSCGVHGNGTVDWDRACTTECEAAMQNSTCKTAGRVFEEFSTYNNSFGLTGRECKVYACGKHLEVRQAGGCLLNSCASSSLSISLYHLCT